MTLDISKIRERVESKLRARGLPLPAWAQDKWIEEASVDLRARYLRGVNLRGANLSGADLHEVDLSGANLAEANLSGTNLSGANLSRADLSGANFTEANLAGTNLERANLRKMNGIAKSNWESAANINGTTLGEAKYLTAWGLYENIVQHFVPKGYRGTEQPLRELANQPWVYLMREGRVLVDYILDRLVVPANKTKAFEVAARLVRNATQLPRNVFTWWNENADRLRLIADGYINWPEKTEGTNELFKLGAFVVHNTINLKGAKLDKIKEILGSAQTILEKNCIPDLDKTLYGDVYIVAQIQQASTVAWYNTKTDKVYLRSAKDDKWAELESILHELGHRYWGKIATNQQRDAWTVWYIRQKARGAELPQVGDMYQVFNAYKETQGLGLTQVIIQDVHSSFGPGGRPRVEIVFTVSTEMGIMPGSLGWSPADQERWAMIQNFPSPYASKNAEECFCEALAFFAMGLLPAEYAEPFSSIWGAK
jgi:uncharacterized protein YjbI with pentapeptide repeats